MWAFQNSVWEFSLNFQDIFRYKYNKAAQYKNELFSRPHFESVCCLFYFGKDEKQNLLMSSEQRGSKIQCFSSVFCYIQNLVTGLDFKVVLDTIPELMNGLRMIWILSRHYNTDERLESLMERIAWELSERVARVVNVRVLFKWVRQICKSSSNHKPAVTCTKIGKCCW